MHAFIGSAIGAIPGELSNSLLMVKFISDFKICLQLLHAESYKEITEIFQEDTISQITSYSPTPSHLALNKALTDFYLLVEESMKDFKYTQPEYKNIHISFQQMLLCLITGYLGNINPKPTLEIIDTKNSFEFATNKHWLTPPPGSENVNILQSVMALVTKYYYTFTNMAPDTDNKIFSSFISSTNFIKDISDAFSPQINLKFSQRIALGILAFLTKKEPSSLIPTIKELNTLDNSEAIMNFICCCLSKKYLDNFTKTKDSSINNKILLALTSFFVYFAGIMTFNLYLTSQTALSTLFLLQYFFTLSLSSILITYLTIRLIIGIDLNDYRSKPHTPAPISSSELSKENNPPPPTSRSTVNTNRNFQLPVATWD